MKVTIRLLREEDLPALEWNGEYSRYRRVYRDAFRRQQAGMLKAWVALREEEMIGQVFLTFRGADSLCPRAYCFLSSFRVKAAYRSMGIGSHLMRKCLTAAHDRPIYLNCAADNERGLAFYRRHGFSDLHAEQCTWSYADPFGNVLTESAPSILMVYPEINRARPMI